MDMHKLEVHNGASADWPLSTLLEGLQDAIDLAADQDQATVLMGHGKPIAAIVPYEVLEQYQQRLQELRTPVWPPSE